MPPTTFRSGTFDTSEVTPREAGVGDVSAGAHPDVLSAERPGVGAEGSSDIYLSTRLGVEPDGVAAASASLTVLRLEPERDRRPDRVHTQVGTEPDDFRLDVRSDCRRHLQADVVALEPEHHVFTHR